MRLLTILSAGLLAVGTVAAVPVEAQRHGYGYGGYGNGYGGGWRGDRYGGRDRHWRGDRRWRGHGRYRPYYGRPGYGGHGYGRPGYGWNRPPHWGGHRPVVCRPGHFGGNCIGQYR